jgi:hypothetical protein
VPTLGAFIENSYHIGIDHRDFSFTQTRVRGPA